MAFKERSKAQSHAPLIYHVFANAPLTSSPLLDLQQLHEEHPADY